nr:MAG: major capsid protein [Microviridae sp.]
MTKVTIGGKRLGSGSGTQINLHGFKRSTHNLSMTWRGSMGVGTLVPFYCNIGLNGDTFDIDLETMVKTVPLMGPLFGSYKLQLDIFEAPIRLYHGALHNNQLNIGMAMNNVKMPLYKFITKTGNAIDTSTPHELRQVNPSSLLSCLGFNGAGVEYRQREVSIDRNINAIPILAYYDIFKNYYANKQEKLCHMISAVQETYDNLQDGDVQSIWARPYQIGGKQVGKWVKIADVSQNDVITLEYCYGGTPQTGEISGEYRIVGWQVTGENVEIWDERNQRWDKAANLGSVQQENGAIIWRPDISFVKKTDNFVNLVRGVNTNGHTSYRSEIKSFDLQDLDKMRETCLTFRSGYDYFIGDVLKNIEPFKTITTNYDDGQNYFKAPMAGLMLKTYQSDIFNNWVQTDYIDDPDTGIAAVTAVDTSSGSFTMDSLLLQKKIYDMLNRVAVSGGTFEDWQEAVYGEDAVRKVEGPMFCGGYSSEIVFDEIVSNTMSADGTPQGTLCGKGKDTNHKNGHVIIKVKEPTIIMGIASITPRLDYSSQNKFYMTDILDMDDLHKPSLDGIGFEDLLEERACWLGTQNDGQNIVRNSVGKIPAWLEYMTAVDEVHGDFADYRKLGWMCNVRRYDFDEGKNIIKDFSTYIDPRKYVTAFADQSLTSQNFWVQIGMRCICRRKISAKVIPNL